jgi:hypothetical protein
MEGFTATLGANCAKVIKEFECVWGRESSAHVDVTFHVVLPQDAPTYWSVG